MKCEECMGRGAVSTMDGDLCCTECQGTGSANPAQRDEYARCKKCGGAQGYGSAMQGGGLCNCTDFPVQTVEAKHIQPEWMDDWQKYEPWVEEMLYTEKHPAYPVVDRRSLCRWISAFVAAHAPQAAPSSSASEYESAEKIAGYIEHDSQCLLPIVVGETKHDYGVRVLKMLAAEIRTKFGKRRG